MSKKRIVVVCPGRGSYTKENLGYLSQRKEIQNDLTLVDSLRSQLNEPTISDLDNAKVFKTSLHTKGEHASPLIYTCSLADYLSIDQNKFEVVAITGNSMGWYLALGFSQALSRENSFHLIQTMGSMMKSQLIGGQIIYPLIDENWIMDQRKESLVSDLIAEGNSKKDCEVYLSISLGGYAVIAGNQQGLNFMAEKLPPIEHYPFKLINHGAFHTPMMNEVSKKAFEQIPIHHFEKPKIPLIDGRGKIWQPFSTITEELYEYTLNHQVCKTYDFTKSISTALKEFAPDHLVLLGPGNSLGGAIGQTLIKNSWKGLDSKESFSSLQKQDPFLISMGMKLQKQVLQAQL